MILTTPPTTKGALAYSKGLITPKAPNRLWSWSISLTCLSTRQTTHRIGSPEERFSAGISGVPTPDSYRRPEGAPIRLPVPARGFQLHQGGPPAPGLEHGPQLARGNTALLLG